MSAAGVLLVATLGFSAAKTVNVSTSAGGTVILPCRTDETGNVPSVEWSKVRGRGEKGAIAFLYRDGCETFEEKDETFHYRTNLIMKELKDGNISLRLSDVRRSDEGTYECKTLQGGPRVVATVELSVDAVSEPKLTVVKAAGGGLALQCEADCWSKEPEITFLDVRGNDVVAEVPKSRYDPGRKCFIVTRRATVHTAGRPIYGSVALQRDVTVAVTALDNWKGRCDDDRVTCRVHQRDTNETRFKEIHMPGDCVKSCIPAIMITVAVSVFVFGALMAIVGCVVGNKTKEDRIISDLKSELCAKEEIIRRLTEAQNDLRSTPRTDCRGAIVNSPSKSALNVSKSIYLPPDQRPQNKDPKPAASRNSTLPKLGVLPQNKYPKPAGGHNHSSPALLTDDDAVTPRSSSAFPSHGAHIGRTMSLSESQRRSNSAKLQRRYTMSYNNNPFSVLANLRKDQSEPLL